LSIFNFLKKKKTQGNTHLDQVSGNQPQGINDIYLVAELFDAQSQSLGRITQQASSNGNRKLLNITLRNADIDALGIPNTLEQMYLVVSIANTGTEVVYSARVTGFRQCWCDTNIGEKWHHIFCSHGLF